MQNFLPNTIKNVDINSLTSCGKNRYVCSVAVLIPNEGYKEVEYCADPTDCVEIGRAIHAEIEARLADGRLVVRKTMRDCQQDWKDNHDFMVEQNRKLAFASESDPLKFKFDETGDQADKDAWLAKKAEIRGRFKKLAEMTKEEVDALYPLCSE